MKRLWVAAALAPLSFAASAQAQQQSPPCNSTTAPCTVSGAATTPAVTSQDGDVTITGSIAPTAPTVPATTAPSVANPSPTATVAAVTVNSYNNVTNSGGISFTGQSNTVGIAVQGVAPASGAASLSIFNSGSITDNETTGYKDTNGDDINDTNTAYNTGQVPGAYLFAVGTARFGIQTTGSTAFNGSITNSGTITIIGENSAAIDVEGAGITGDLVHSGTITVTGGDPYFSQTGLPTSDGFNTTTNNPNNTGNDVSYGIHSGGLIGGSVVISGTVSALGKNATAVALDGGVGGVVEIYGSLTATGYETTTPLLAATTVNTSVIPTSALAATTRNNTNNLTTNSVTNSTVTFSTSVQTLIQNQAAEELLQGGPALQIGGSVAGGISLDAPIVSAVTGTTTTTAVSGATITSYGSAPAVLIGGAAPISVGAISSTATSAQVTTSGVGSTFDSNEGYGLVVGGAIAGVGLYPLTLSSTTNLFEAVNATGLSIGSNIDGTASGGLVTIAGGVNLVGTLEASTTGFQVTTTTSTTGVVSSTDDTPTGNATALLVNNAAIAAHGGANTETAGAINISGTVYAIAATQTFVGGTYTQKVGTNTFTTTIGAPSSGASPTAANTSTIPTATAILLGANATVPSIVNTGTIEALITGLSTAVVPAGGGTEGYAIAIQDRSGTLTSVTNNGVIAAAVVPSLPTDLVNPAYSRSVAIDLSQNTTTATVTQAQEANVVGYEELPGTVTYITTTVVPSITGDVLFGSGNNTLNLSAGTLTGGLSFAAGSVNTINITNGAVETGPLAEGVNGKLAVNVASGVLDITEPTTNVLDSTLIEAAPTSFNGNASNKQVAIGVSTVNIGSGGRLIFSVFAPTASALATTAPGVPSPTQPQFNATGNVTIASGGSIGLNFLSRLTGTTSVTYDVIETTGQITGANTQTALGQLPYLYQGVIGTTTLNGENAVAITVTPKTVAQLGLNPAQASAFNAFYAAISNPDVPGSKGVAGGTAGTAGGTGNVVTAVLGQTTKAGFQHLYNEFLPDYSGGEYDTMVMGQEAIASAEADTAAKLQGDGTRGWVQEIGISDDRSSAGVVGYSGKGFGVAGGSEVVDGRNTIGIAAAMLTTAIGDTGRPAGSSQSATALEGGVYWRNGRDEGLIAGASLNGGWTFLQSHRVLLEQSGENDATFYREAKANWDGAVVSASFNVAYKASFGRYFVEPQALAEYVMLYESAYTETGGGGAVDLSVNSQLNKEGVVQGAVMFGATYGDTVHWTPSMTLGWREVVLGGPASTTAHFANGAPFTLSPDYQDEKGGLLARLGLRASGNYADFSAGAGGVFRPGYDAIDARATARFLF